MTPKQRSMSSDKTRICIALPIYNEEVILEPSLRMLHAFCMSVLDDMTWELVIADNGSTDASERIGRRLATELPHVSYDRRALPGRGGALQAVWSARDADIYMYMDSDLATNLCHIRECIGTILSGSYDIAVGSRLIRGSITSRSLVRELCSRIYGIVPRLFFPSLPIRDCQCGFKAISRRIQTELLSAVRDSGWFFDTELLIRAHSAGYRIAEMPVDWREQRYARRKSKVKLLQTAFRNIRKLMQLKKELH